MKMKYISRLLYLIFAMPALMLMFSSCKDGTSYADLLKQEDRVVNWYLAQQRIVPYVPADSVFEVGPNAPFYRMDSDGNVYMRVINMGDMNNRPKKGQTVYFRFTRTNIKMYADGGSIGGAGSLENNMSGSSWSLIYGNTVLTSTTQLGTGLQVPLGYLGYNCEVDLVVKSEVGRTDDIGECIPYLYTNLKYFKAEY